jgi:hypothetical protein
MRASLLVAALVAGCASGNDGFAVDLTVVLDSTVTDDQVAALTRLHLETSNAEAFITDVDATGKFSSRSSAIRYKPAAATTGTLTFTLTAFDGADQVASGQIDVVLNPGKTVDATVTLSGTGGGGGDMGGPYDLVGGGCVLDTDCPTGFFCSNGVCAPRFSTGTTCTRDAQCVTNVCADGYCCNMACGGICAACDVSGSAGNCVAVPAGAPHAGHGSCLSDGTVCGGSCDGTHTATCTYPSGACAQAPYQGTCANGTCTCPAMTLMCAANGNRCTPESYNEFACGSPTVMCGGATPSCYDATCKAIQPTYNVTYSAALNFPHFADHDGTWMYFTDTGNKQLWRAIQGVGTQPVLMTTAASSTIGVATDGSYAYYGVDPGSSGSASIWRIPVGASNNSPAATMVASGFTQVWLMATDANNVYWSQLGIGANAGAIMKAPKADCTTNCATVATVLANGLNTPNYLASDGNYVYFANGGTITHNTGSVMRVPVNGSPSQVQVLQNNLPSPYGLAIDGTYVYWSNSGYAAADGSVWKMPLAGGTPIPLMQNVASPGTVRVDPVALYVIMNATDIDKLPLCGGPMVQLAHDTTNYFIDMIVGNPVILYLAEGGTIWYATR